MIRGLFFLAGIVAVMAFTAAFVLDTVARGIGWHKRAMLAALVGGFLPALFLVLIRILIAEQRDSPLTLALTALVIGTVMAATVGYPVACWFTRKCEQSRVPDVFK